MQIGVYGAGYLGTVISACLAIRNSGNLLPPR